MKPIIKVRGLSKRYQLGERQMAYATLRDKVADTLRAPLKRFRSRAAQEQSTLWALKEIDFDVQPGEILGIVGNNGAGKSTLLKILSRITEPTTGRVTLYGRVGSLLEVGTGFHPELSGRENIYLNGAILGMRKAEITRKFDEIIAFAEIEKFIDTPVKRYSSGMYVRLAFAVAAYLEPDILVVDEVLAVGDLAFQKKCLGKMQDVMQHGRTILFVSHNIAAIKSLCTRAMMLESGRISCSGDVDHVIDTYLSGDSDMTSSGIIPEDVPRSGTGEVRARRIELLDVWDKPLARLYLGKPFRVRLTLDVIKDVEDVIVGLSIASLDGTRIGLACSTDSGQPPLTLTKGRHHLSVTIEVALQPRQYTFDIIIARSNGADVDVVSRTLQFEALGVTEKAGDHYRWTAQVGFIRLRGQWQLSEDIKEPSQAEAAALVNSERA